jgi:cell division protein FtsW
VAQRINRFLDPASGDTFNIDIATESFIRGGWFGRGPGEGTIKRILPEGHTDFVFAVAAEEFGVVLCLILVSLFAFIVIRALIKAMRTKIRSFVSPPRDWRFCFGCNRPSTWRSICISFRLRA